jgi:hypothetical protein
MRWLLISALVLTVAAATAQNLVPVSSSSSSNLLPNAPDAHDHQDDQNSLDGPDVSDASDAAQSQTTSAHPQNVVALAEASFKRTGDGVPECDAIQSMRIVSTKPDPKTGLRKPCSELVYPYQQFLSTDVVIPMTWQQKGYVALHNVSDLANLGTIVGISAFTVGIDSHTAYGPGIKGFAKTAGVSLSQDVTGQLFGTFAIPALVHQDPRYFRMPQASVQRRIFYCLSRTFVSQHDDGTPMPNYATLATYPIASELGNLYVPGIHPDAASTMSRIAIGLATDPANNLLNEFLPDVAKRIHVRIIFVQRILNNVASGTNGLTVQ